jgi:hypothetical protein
VRALGKLRRELRGRSPVEAVADLGRLYRQAGLSGVVERSGYSIRRHQPASPPVPPAPPVEVPVSPRHPVVGTYPWNVAFDPFFDLTPEILAANEAVVSRIDERRQEVRSATWFLPRFEHALFGGVYTILRVMDWMAEHHGVEHRLVIFDGQYAADADIRDLVSDAFPGLGGIDVVLPPGTAESSSTNSRRRTSPSAACGRAPTPCPGTTPRGPSSTWFRTSSRPSIRRAPSTP